MKHKRTAPDASPSAAKKSRTSDGAAPKHAYVETFQRTSCVRMALGGAVVSPAWAKLLRDAAKKMTTLTWVGARAFNHFVLANVIGGQFEIADRNGLVQVIGRCFTAGGVGNPQTAFNKQPVVAAWIEAFRALSADFPLVERRGMTQVIKAATNQYAVAVENYLAFGLRDLYVRALKGLAVADAELVALRVLSRSVAKRKRNFSFALSSDDEWKSKAAKRDPEREAAIGRAVAAELDRMGIMKTYGDAFRFLRRLQQRLAQDDARRRIANPNARPSRAFSLAPLTSMKPCFIRVDKSALNQLWSAHFRGDAMVEAPRCVESVLRARARPGLAIGQSFQTDGTQLVVPYLATTTKTIFLSAAAHAKRVAAAAARSAKLAEYHVQTTRLDSGGELGADEVRLRWTAVKPRLMADKACGRPLKGSFADADHGFFDRESAHATGGPLPAIVAIDPGQKNIWCASLFDPAALDTRGEARRILNLTRREYNQQIGLFAFRKWLDKAKKNAAKHDFVAAQDALAAHSLKGVGLAEFEANFVVQRRSFSVLSRLYGSRGFGKRRFVMQQRKQAFDDNFTAEAAARFRKAAGTDDFVVAYGDGTFPLSMKGMDGGGSAHKRLMTLLSKKARIVLTREYRTTKACPKCRSPDSKMVQPKGNATFRDKNGVERRKRIHGLSQCGCCHRLWSRDYAASLNIARSFESYFRTGGAATYLSR